MSVRFTIIGFFLSLTFIAVSESVYAQGPRIDIPIDSLKTDFPERVTGEITLHVFNTGLDTLEFEICERISGTVPFRLLGSMDPIMIAHDLDHDRS